MLRGSRLPPDDVKNDEGGERRREPTQGRQRARAPPRRDRERRREQPRAGRAEDADGDEALRAAAGDVPQPRDDRRAEREAGRRRERLRVDVLGPLRERLQDDRERERGDEAARPRRDDEAAGAER